MLEMRMKRLCASTLRDSPLLQTQHHPRFIPLQPPAPCHKYIRLSIPVGAYNLPSIQFLLPSFSKIHPNLTTQSLVLLSSCISSMKTSPASLPSVPKLKPCDKIPDNTKPIHSPGTQASTASMRASFVGPT